MIYVIYYPVPITGHIAIVLSGLKKTKNIHISFYPQVKKSKMLFRLQSFKDDGTHVAHIIAIPSEESCGKGLSEQAILDWWEKDFKPKSTAYGLLNNNCASYVYRALIQGQDHADSLGNSRLLEKSWFCSPNNVMGYAHKLSALLTKNLNADESLLSELIKIKDLCTLDKVVPHEMAMGIYFHIKQSSNPDIAMLQLPFCKAVKRTLKIIAIHLPEDIPSDFKTELIERCRLAETNEKNFDLAFETLYELIEYVLDIPVLVNLIEDAIHYYLLPLMNRMIENLNSPDIDLNNPERIDQLMTFLGHKIDDSKNPHREYFDFGTKKDLDRVRMLGY